MNIEQLGIIKKNKLDIKYEKYLLIMTLKKKKKNYNVYVLHEDTYQYWSHTTPLWPNKGAHVGKENVDRLSHKPWL